jgi:N-acetylmuramoyl-L-alanine amidase
LNPFFRARHSRPAPRSRFPGTRAGLVALMLVAASATLGAAPASRRSAPAGAKPAPELVRIRFWTAPDHTRLVFDLSGPVADPVLRLIAPDEFEVFLRGARKSPAVSTEFVGDSLVAEVIPAPSDSGLSIRIGLKQAVTPLGFVLAAQDDVPNRVVVDVPAPPNPAADQKLEAQVEELKKSRRFIVAIDPGHGGDDPGAIGYHKLQEADITLAIAKRLKAEIDEIPGMTAFLTRTGDYFVPLRKRIDLARKVQADVLVSIHCNASRNRDATGTEVYFLSLTGATDEASRALAESENAADLVGGVPPDTGNDLLSILFDLRQNDTIRKSSEIAEFVVDALGQDSRLTTRGVKQAGFVVLKAPEIPSILVESAFITNPREASMLRDKQFQAKFAENLAEGIQRYVASITRASSN